MNPKQLEILAVEIATGGVVKRTADQLVCISRFDATAEWAKMRGVLTRPLGNDWPPLSSGVEHTAAEERSPPPLRIRRRGGLSRSAQAGGMIHSGS